MSEEARNLYWWIKEKVESVSKLAAFRDREVEINDAVSNISAIIAAARAEERERAMEDAAKIADAKAQEFVSAQDGARSDRCWDHLKIYEGQREACEDTASAIRSAIPKGQDMSDRGELPFEIYEAIRQAAQSAVLAGERIQTIRDVSRDHARQRAKDECVSAVWKAFDAAAAIRATQKEPTT